MMYDFDKAEIKKQITIEMVFTLLEEWGGEPSYQTEDTLVSRTICHNKAHDGSRKLYYYANTGLFHCYTGCQEPSFDVFELFIKIQENQNHTRIDLNQSILYLSQYFNLTNITFPKFNFVTIQDWEIINKIEQRQYEKYNKAEPRPYDKPIDKKILDNFAKVRILDWEREGIKKEVSDAASIGYYAGGMQITIPHFDEYGNLIGIRGRALIKEEAELYGKYRPVYINKHFYSHALGLNLYNLNHSKNMIGKMGKAIIFEGEKSVLKYRSFFGEENDISVAVCGSNISLTQINFLIKYGAKEVVIALDRQFQEPNDTEFKRLVKKLRQYNRKFKNLVNISLIFDKNMITDYKAAPIDHGPDIFLKLFKERIVL